MIFVTLQAAPCIVWSWSLMYCWYQYSLVSLSLSHLSIFAGSIPTHCNVTATVLNSIPPFKILIRLAFRYLPLNQTTSSLSTSAYPGDSHLIFMICASRSISTLEPLRVRRRRGVSDGRSGGHTWGGVQARRGEGLETLAIKLAVHCDGH